MKVELTPLSPIHVGTDDAKSLSHLSDYFYDESSGYVCYVDHTKIERFLEEWENPTQIINDFVKRIRVEKTQKSNKYNILVFLKDYQQNPMDFVKKSLPVSDPQNLKNQKIHVMISSAGRPYIPGSSIKGAIRTALIFEELKNNKYILKFIQKHIENTYWLYKSLKNERDRKKKKELERNFQKAARKLYNFQEKIFGSFINDTLKFLQVSDTTFFPIQALKIYHTKRVNLNARRMGREIPMNYEAIQPNSSMVEFVIQTKAIEKLHTQDHKLKHLKNYLCIGEESNIFPLLNQYSSAFIQHELKVLIGRSKGLEPIILFYKTILEKINKLDQRKEAIISLGSCKTFFNSTVDLLFNEDVLMKLRKFEKLGFSRKGNNFVDPFPITRTIYFEKGNICGVFGWAHIKQIN